MSLQVMLLALLYPTATGQFYKLWHDGSYDFNYHTSDDQHRTELRYPDGTVLGKYAYVSPTGQKIEVEYNAGRHGYKERRKFSKPRYKKIFSYPGRPSFDPDTTAGNLRPPVITTTPKPPTETIIRQPIGIINPTTWQIGRNPIRITSTSPQPPAVFQRPNVPETATPTPVVGINPRVRPVTWRPDSLDNYLGIIQQLSTPGIRINTKPTSTSTISPNALFSKSATVDPRTDQNNSIWSLNTLNAIANSNWSNRTSTKINKFEPTSKPQISETTWPFPGRLDGLPVPVPVPAVTRKPVATPNTQQEIPQIDGFYIVTSPNRLRPNNNGPNRALIFRQPIRRPVMSGPKVPDSSRNPNPLQSDQISPEILQNLRVIDGSLRVIGSGPPSSIRSREVFNSDKLEREPDYQIVNDDNPIAIINVGKTGKILRNDTSIEIITAQMLREDSRVRHSLPELEISIDNAGKISVPVPPENQRGRVFGRDITSATENPSISSNGLVTLQNVKGRQVGPPRPPPNPQQQSPSLNRPNNFQVQEPRFAPQSFQRPQNSEFINNFREQRNPNGFPIRGNFQDPAISAQNVQSFRPDRQLEPPVPPPPPPPPGFVPPGIPNQTWRNPSGIPFPPANFNEPVRNPNANFQGRNFPDGPRSNNAYTTNLRVPISYYFQDQRVPYPVVENNDVFHPRMDLN